MAEYTQFQLPSGATVLVQSSLLQPAPAEGVTPASGLRDKALVAWDDGIDMVREVAAGIVAKLKHAAAGADQVEVEFGVNISGKTGIILVEGEAAANLKVTIAWKGKAADAEAAGA
jgi:hypothetical protein